MQDFHTLQIVSIMYVMVNELPVKTKYSNLKSEKKKKHYMYIVPLFFNGTRENVSLSFFYI